MAFTSWEQLQVFTQLTKYERQRELDNLQRASLMIKMAQDKQLLAVEEFIIEENVYAIDSSSNSLFLAHKI